MTDDDDILRIWTVYDHPRDMPDKFVARLWRVVRGREEPIATDEFFAAAELDAVRAFLISRHLTRLDRDPNDDPCIVETWL